MYGSHWLLYSLVLTNHGWKLPMTFPSYTRSENRYIFYISYTYQFGGLLCIQQAFFGQHLSKSTSFGARHFLFYVDMRFSAFSHRWTRSRAVVYTWEKPCTLLSRMDGQENDGTAEKH